jgi:hypothetical protein
MDVCRRSIVSLALFLPVSASVLAWPQAAPSSSGAAESRSSSSTKGASRPVADSALDAGAVSNGIYRNKMLGFACKIPDGWVLRTDELNAGNEESTAAADNKAAAGRKSEAICPNAKSCVLLAAFSRPPAAAGDSVNSSILIAAESAASYPGLTEAAQYFGPLTEVAKAQGFELDEDPYAIALGTKTLVRADFHKSVGAHVMLQSTLALLSHGYAVSITVIGGTDDEVEDLVDGLSFAGSAGAKK